MHTADGVVKRGAVNYNPSWRSSALAPPLNDRANTHSLCGHVRSEDREIFRRSGLKWYVAQPQCNLITKQHLCILSAGRHFSQKSGCILRIIAGASLILSEARSVVQAVLLSVCANHGTPSRQITLSTSREHRLNLACAQIASPWQQ